MKTKKTRHDKPNNRTKKIALKVEFAHKYFQGQKMVQHKFDFIFKVVRIAHWLDQKRRKDNLLQTAYFPSAFVSIYPWYDWQNQVRFFACAILYNYFVVFQNLINQIIVIKYRILYNFCPRCALGFFLQRIQKLKCIIRHIQLNPFNLIFHETLLHVHDFSFYQAKNL